MKNHALIFAAVYGIVLTGCGEEEMPIYDMNPVVLNVYVQNAAGQDLLNADTPDNIINTPISVVYLDESYELIENSNTSNTVKSRDYLPKFYGVEKAIDSNNVSYLLIGEFDGGLDGSTGVTLKIGKNTYSLVYENKVKYGKKGVDVNRKFYLDGTLIKEINSGTTCDFHITY